MVVMRVLIEAHGLNTNPDVMDVLRRRWMGPTSAMIPSPIRIVIVEVLSPHHPSVRPW
jgi:hypothetical protein